MNRIRFRRFFACLSAALLLFPSASLLTACGDAEPSAAESDTAVSDTPVTLPDLTDTREPTSVDAYADRLHTAFANAEPAPAEHFSYTAADGAVTVTAYTGDATVVVIPDSIEGLPVVSIEKNAFENNKNKENIRAISIPDSVIDVAYGALAGCESLETLRTPMATATGALHMGSLFGGESYETNGAYIPTDLTTLILTAGDAITPYAFYDCPLEAVFLPAGMTTIGVFAFYGSDHLAYISLDQTALRSIGEHAFTNCGALLLLELPATVTDMGFAMLEGCGALEVLTVPFVGGGSQAAAETEAAETEDGEALSSDHLGYLFGARAYVHAAGYIPASLIRVTVSGACDEIPANAFFECASIREIVLPEGVTAIGHRAFYGCARLSKLTIPDSVTTLGDDALHGCIRLVDLEVGAGVTTLGVQVFMDCMSLKTVTLPAGVTYLPNSTFAGCRSLETLTAPGVTAQGEQVFRHCDNLKTTVIPAAD